MGRMWKYDDKWYTYLLNYCTIFIEYIQFTNESVGCITQPERSHAARRPQVGDPWFKEKLVVKNHPLLHVSSHRNEREKPM